MTTLFKQIKHFFDTHLTLSNPEDYLENKLQVATVALFLEMMTIDDHAEPKELALIAALIHRNFSLTDAQTAELLALAEQQRQQATDYFQFTSLFNKAYSLEQKVRLIESLWEIAFVDGVLDANEEYLVRKIADLLHVPHNAFILAKLRAEPLMAISTCAEA